MSVYLLWCVFLQILHTNGNHWVTITSIGCESGTVKMYDSLRMSAVLSKSVAHQVASILNTHHPQITVDIPEVQQQRGSNDCGLFAIAFATSILKGEDPSSVKYLQSSMRQHLVSCLEKQCMTVFPRQQGRRRKLNPISVQEIIPVYCLCRLPKSGRMAECTICGENYHRKCVGIIKKPFCCSHCYES